MESTRKTENESKVIENDNNFIFYFMNYSYYILIGLIILGVFWSWGKFPNGLEVLNWIITIIGFFQILVLINLIILNKKSIGFTIVNIEYIEEFHENGNLKIRGGLINGEKNGIWDSFDIDGNLFDSQLFREGKPVGLPWKPKKN